MCGNLLGLLVNRLGLALDFLVLRLLLQLIKLVHLLHLLHLKARLDPEPLREECRLLLSSLQVLEGLRAVWVVPVVHLHLLLLWTVA